MSNFLWLEPEEFPAWRRRLELERRAGTLTATRRDALRAILAFVGEEGLFPSDQAVAELAACSARTVRRARVDARELGLLTWERTRKFVDGRWRQGSNRYAVHVPLALVCSDGQNGRRDRKKEEKRLTRREQPALPTLPAGLPSLAEIAQARQLVIVKAWQARRSSAVMAGDG